MLKPVYFAFVNTMLEFFFANYTFVKSRAHSPRPTSKIVAMIPLRRAILMKTNPVVSLHAHRLFSGRACSCKKDPCSHQTALKLFKGGHTLGALNLVLNINLMEKKLAMIQEVVAS